MSALLECSGSAHARPATGSLRARFVTLLRAPCRHNTSRVSAEFPNVSLAQVHTADCSHALALRAYADGHLPTLQAKAIMGDSLVAAAKSGPKKMEATATSEQLSDMFGYKAFCKSLRYGANLTLENVRTLQLLCMVCAVARLQTAHGPCQWMAPPAIVTITHGCLTGSQVQLRKGGRHSEDYWQLLYGKVALSALWKLAQW